MDRLPPGDGGAPSPDAGEDGPEPGTPAFAGHGLAAQ